jgi:hypothetical protein
MPAMAGSRRCQHQQRRPFVFGAVVDAGEDVAVQIDHLVAP